MGSLCALVALASPAAAATFTANFQTANINSSSLTATGGALSMQISSNLFVKATAWNATPTVTNGVTTYKITQAQLGDYYGGLGVTSGASNDDLTVNGCGLGDCGSHQIDNLGDGTNSKSYDFVQFSFTNAAGAAQSVKISSLDRTAWGTANASLNAAVYDDDFSVGTGFAVSNNQTVASLATLFAQNYGAAGTCSANQSVTSGSTSLSYCDDTTAITGNNASATWYIAASVLPNAYGADSNVDAFKIKSLDVTAVPEPASWSMMILGFGLIGSALRRRQAKTVTA